MVSPAAAVAGGATENVLAPAAVAGGATENVPAPAAVVGGIARTSPLVPASRIALRSL